VAISPTARAAVPSAKPASATHSPNQSPTTIATIVLDHDIGGHATLKHYVIVIVLKRMPHGYHLRPSLVWRYTMKTLPIHALMAF
jgi:hypothetical protein